jgi:hypothetical protein
MGVLSNLLERKQVDAIAPVIQEAPAASALEENYRVTHAVWQHSITKLEKLEARLDREKLTISSLKYAELLDQIAYQKMTVESAHQAMAEASASLEAWQFAEGKKEALKQKKCELQALRSQITSLDEEIKDLLIQEAELPQKRLYALGRRDDMLRRHALLDDEVNNAHS